MDEQLHDSAQFEMTEDKPIIKVIGVGGGGGNAVNYMYEQKIPNVNFVVCNTDKHSLELSKVPTKLVLGYDITRGLGAGNVPDVGRQCAEASADEIRKLFTDETEMVFITAGMGGGTGTGAGPVVARLAKEAGMLTIGIITVPFMFEGESKILKALEGAEQMREQVDALLVINNENLVQLYSDLTLYNAFAKADDTLANAARSISEIINESLYINVDFRDVKTTLRGAGTAIIATAIGEGKNRITKAIEGALHSPLLKRHDIKTAKRLLLKLNAWKDAEHPIMAEELKEINDFTQQLPKTIDVKWGVGDDPELGDKVKITVLAAGFDVTLRESITGEKEETVVFTSESREEPKTVSMQSMKDDSKKHERIAEMYGKSAVINSINTTNKLKFAVLKPSQFDDDEIIRKIEQQPAYRRDSKFLQDLNTEKKEETVSRPAVHREESGDSNVIQF